MIETMTHLHESKNKKASREAGLFNQTASIRRVS